VTRFTYNQANNRPPHSKQQQRINFEVTAGVVFEFDVAKKQMIKNAPVEKEYSRRTIEGSQFLLIA
jgi:hypothetical protein